jgi:hypothetical protein
MFSVDKKTKDRHALLALTPSDESLTYPNQVWKYEWPEELNSKLYALQKRVADQLADENEKDGKENRKFSFNTKSFSEFLGFFCHSSLAVNFEPSYRSVEYRVFQFATENNAVQAHQALNSWFKDIAIPQIRSVIKNYQVLASSVEQTKDLFEQSRPHAYQLDMHLFHWKTASNGTTSPPENNTFQLLPFLIATSLQGKTIHEKLSPLRLRISQNKDHAELMALHPEAKSGERAVTISIKVITLPGFSRPIIRFDFGYRQLVSTFKEKQSNNLRFLFMPKDCSYFHSVPLVYDHKQDGSKFLSENHILNSLLKQYNLSQTVNKNGIVSAQSLAELGGRGLDCVVKLQDSNKYSAQKSHKNGLTSQDKIDLMQGILKHLADLHLEEFHLPDYGKALTGIQYGKRPSYFPGSSQQTSIPTEHLTGSKGPHVVVLYHSSMIGQIAMLTEYLENLTWENQAVLKPTFIQLADGVHCPIEYETDEEGSRHYVKIQERKKKKRQLWQEQVESIKSRTQGEPIHAFIIFAPKLYRDINNNAGLDDPLNKPIAKAILGKAFHVPVQYLDSLDVPSWNTQSDEIEISNPQIRVTNAITDALLHAYGVVHRQFLRDLPNKAKLWDEDTQFDSVYIFTVVQKNNDRFHSKASAVLPVCTKLNLNTPEIIGSFASWTDRELKLKSSQFFRLPEMLGQVASLSFSDKNPIQNSKLQSQKPGFNRESQIKMAVQDWLETKLITISKSGETALVLLDAMTLRRYWPWLKNTDLNPENISLNGKHNFQTEIQNLTLVRLRDEDSPRSIHLKYFDTANYPDIEFPGPEPSVRAHFSRNKIIHGRWKNNLKLYLLNLELNPNGVPIGGTKLRSYAKEVTDKDTGIKNIVSQQTNKHVFNTKAM